MTQEEKELLIKDLCGRLPYGVFVDENIERLDKEPVIYTYDYHPYIDRCKPYLRPMPSMTEEENEEFKAFHCVDEWHPKFYRAMCNLPNINNMINWLDKKMFDYRGLIPMGLALPAKEGMYNN